MMHNKNKEKAYDRLIEAGVKLFGQYGFGAVSTRQISKEAKVNIAAICYHFGSKKKFYEQVVLYLTQSTQDLINKFDILKFETLEINEAKIMLADFIRQYQQNFISDYGINRLNIFMYETFLQSPTDTKNIYTHTIKNTYNFYTKILTIYFNKTGKDKSLIYFSIALIHGIIQAYYISTTNIAPSEIKSQEQILEQSITTVLN